MKTIRFRIAGLVAGSILAPALALFIYFYFREDMSLSVHIAILLIILILFFIALCRALSIENDRYKMAKLIMENQIMHIRIAQIEDRSDSSSCKTARYDCLEAYVSCFGVLLDSKVIKFNIDGIMLKKVEVGTDFISFDYEFRQKIQTLRILHANIDKKELQSFVERFSYETGVIPVTTIM